MGFPLNGIQSWAELAGLVLTVLLIGGFVVGAIGWFLRLEYNQGTAKDQLKSTREDLNRLESRVETKVDNLQASMQTILVTMGEMKGQIQALGNQKNG